MATNPDGSYNNSDYMGPVAERDSAPNNYDYMGPVATRDAAPAVAPVTPAAPAPKPLPEFSYDLNGVNPTTDFAYNSFLRGANFDKATAQAQTEYARQQLQAQMQAQIPNFAQQMKRGITDAGESSAARGAARSSSRLQAQNDVQSSVSSSEAAFRQGISDKQAQLAFDLQNQSNSIERQRMDQEMESRTRLVQQKNEQVAYQRALQQLGLA